MEGRITLHLCQQKDFNKLHTSQIRVDLDKVVNTPKPRS